MALFGVAVAVMMWAACQGGQTAKGYVVYVGGSAANGQQLINKYRCGACHTIPGIPDAQGAVGPPLTFFARRTMIAGELPNSPRNLVRWIRSPKTVEPGTAMPALGLTEQEARDVAAYLYTLR